MEEEGADVMRVELIISGVGLALIILPLLAWKWRVKVSLAIPGAIIIGGLTGLMVNQIDTAAGGFNIVALVFIELAFILIITALVIGVRFYRDPERSPGETQNVILSPADGKVIYINKVDQSSSLVSTKGKRKYNLEEITSTDLLDSAAYLVGIDMNVFNVHVTRSPICGEIILCKRTKGKFISLRNQESEIVNERVTTVIGNGVIRVAVVQISSRLVRKIVSNIKKGDVLDIGQRIGSIVFGSQVDLVIPGPENIKIEVKDGDEVKAGISVIARYNISAFNQGHLTV